MKRLVGVLLIGGAFTSAVVAYAGKPDVSTCQVINAMNQQFGQAPSCSSSPNATLMWLAAALAVAGLVVLVVKTRRKLP